MLLVLKHTVMGGVEAAKGEFVPQWGMDLTASDESIVGLELPTKGASILVKTRET